MHIKVRCGIKTCLTHYSIGQHLILQNSSVTSVMVYTSGHMGVAYSGGITGRGATRATPQRRGVPSVNKGKTTPSDSKVSACIHQMKVDKCNLHIWIKNKTQKVMCKL